MRLLISLLILLWSQASVAQSYRLTNDLPVKDLSGQDLSNPWTGGLNNAQFSAADMNLDGVDDMVVFDRSDNSFLVYLNEGRSNQVKYRYAPAYQANFADCNCREWALMRDYNCDGLPDVWCGRNSGSNHLVYEQVVYNGDSVGFELRFDPILTLSGLNVQFLFTLRTDIPAILDVDYDGDIDVVSSTNGVNYLILYRNLAMERYGRCDTLDFETEPGCWGEFAESNADNTLAIGDTANCPRGGPEGEERLHVGSTMLVFDMNGDSLVDILLGDVSYATMVAAYNGGTVYDAKMTSVETDYPQSDSSIFVELFPAAFYEDINNDGIKDLLLAPNPKSAEAENVNGIAWYENLGQNDQVDFRFRGRTFLGTGHIDNGEDGSPIFFDYNGDNLMDLLLASTDAVYLTNSGLSKINQIQLFENIGSLESPAYQLVDSNYIDLSYFANPGPTEPNFTDPYLTLGDLDDDGDQDLLVGLNAGVVAHFVNTAPLGSPANFVLSPDPFLLDDQGKVIGGVVNGLKNGVFGGSAAPDLYDFDVDGDLDLFIGTRFGRLELYENTGSPINPIWQINTPSYGQIKVSDEFGNFFTGFARPRFFDYDQDNVTELLIAGEDGRIEVFENLANAMTDSLMRDRYWGPDFGSLINMDAAILDTSNHYSYAIGGPRGGIVMYAFRNAPDTIIIDPTPIDTPLQTSFRLYPNPSDGLVWVEKPDETESLSIEVVNLLGQSMLTKTSREARFSIDMSGRASGIYIVRVQSDSQEWVERIWIK